MTLRIVDAHRFNVIYTTDDWATVQEASSKAVGYPGSYVDIPTPILAPGETRELIFTLHWPERADSPDHWLGRNIEILVGEQDRTAPAPLEQKPRS